MIIGKKLEIIQMEKMVAISYFWKCKFYLITNKSFVALLRKLDKFKTVDNKI